MSKSGSPPDTPEFDHATAAEMQATGAKKLLASLKAVQNANKASSDREFAVNFVRAQEAIIHQLFDAGLSQQDILLRLIDSLPAIPAEELRYALRTVGRRNKRFNVAPAATAPVAPGETPSAEMPRPQPVAPNVNETKIPPGDKTSPPPQKPIPDLPDWADGSDQRADESDEEYAFRKQIEGPPDAKRKFIGEHNT